MSAISKHDLEHIAPLSGLQKSMLFRSLAEPDSGHYIEQLSFEFSAFDVVAMQAALDAVVSTRWAMRTAFLWREQPEPKQLTFREVQCAIEFKKRAGNHTARLSEEEKQAAVQEDRIRGIELNQAPLMRMTVLTDEDAVRGSSQSAAFCIWTFHHAVVDGWSIALLQHELLRYYKEYRQGKAAILPNTDTATLKRQAATPESQGLWKVQLENASRERGLQFLPRPGFTERRYAEIHHSSDAALAERIRLSCQSHRVTFANIAHAAWSLILCHLNGTSNILYGTIDSGRSELKNGETAVGMYMQLLPMSINIDEVMTVRSFLQGIQRRQWSLQADKLPSPADIALALQRAPGDDLFDTLLLVQNYPAAILPEDIGLLRYDGFEQADAPLVMSIGNTDILRLLARFQTDRVEPSQASAIQSHLLRMLELLANSTELTTLGELLDQFAGSPKKTTALQSDIVEERCIDRFMQAVEAHPDKIALIDADGSYTYAELASRAEQIREQLAKTGVTEQSTVGIFLPRSIDSVASSLAVLAQGASFMPIDPAFPRAMVECMLADSSAHFIVAARAQALESLHRQINTIILPASVDTRLDALSVLHSENTTMCVVFTSGSTGKPKGIALHHTAVLNRLRWMENHYPFVENEICAARTPVNFVDAVAEIFGPLCAGVCCRIIDDNESSSLSEIAGIVEQCGITRLSLVPSLLQALLTEFHRNLRWPALRVCIVSGEALATRLVGSFYDAMPHCRLLNLYGSTEVAADALYYETSAEDSHDQQWAAIGKPIDNMAAWICNSVGRPLPIGTIGELQISGTGVAGGYINDAALSANKFPGNRFRSGDLAYEDTHGVFHYVGRADRQIKVRGQRVEPGAIESTLIAYPGIRQAVTVLSGQKLVCFYTGKQSGNNALTEFLGQKLPAYSVPSLCEHTDEIPLTHNGKVDYKRLQRIAAELPLQCVESLTRPVSLSLHQKELGLAIGNIWSDLLPDAVVSTDTDFFQAGGHSLLAMQMIASVERALGLTVPLAVFMNNTRLADFARVLFEGIPRLAAPELITLRDGDASAPALFCIQGDAYNIVPHCKVDRKIYWISQWSICVDLTRDPQPVPIETILETAQRYAKHIEHARPQGDFRILASCGAAVVALEVARILRNKGRAPEKLVLMDLPRGELTTASQRGFKNRQGRNIVHSAYGYMMRVWGGKKIKAYLYRKRINRKVAAGIALSDLEAVELMHIRLSDALTLYQPTIYDGPIELVLSKSWYRGIERVEDAYVPVYWQPYLTNVNAIHFSPANIHAELLQGEGAAFAAQIMEQ